MLPLQKRMQQSCSSCLLTSNMLQMCIKNKKYRRLKVILSNSFIQNKYRIICELCKKSTITYNIKHLLLGSQSANLFHNNFIQFQQKKSDKNKNYHQRRRKSKTKFECEIKCQKQNHNSKVKYYCPKQKKLFCNQCNENNDIQVINIEDAINEIYYQNIKMKQQILSRSEQINKCIDICKQNWKLIQETQSQMKQRIQQQFKSLIKKIKSRQKQIKEIINKQYLIKFKQYRDQLNDYLYIQGCLKQYIDYQFDSTQSFVYFFQTYSMIRQSINQIKTQFILLKKQHLNCLQNSFDIADLQKNIFQYLHLHNEEFKPFLTEFRQEKNGRISNRAISSRLAFCQQKKDLKNKTLNNYKPTKKKSIYDDYCIMKLQNQKINNYQDYRPLTTMQIHNKKSISGNWQLNKKSSMCSKIATPNLKHKKK